jgi:NAD-dependent deacetylase
MVNITKIFKAQKKYADTFKDSEYIPKITIFTGAGISVESGLQTFRDGGLWNNFSISEVATAYAIKHNLETVLNFYNDRRKEVLNANPNEAHHIIKELEKYFNVVVVTQNVDNLHERAGSGNVYHLHGEILRSRPIATNRILYDQLTDINVGDRCSVTNSQLRPDIVLFGETLNSETYYDSRRHIRESDIFIVTGTSLEVEPAASLIAEGFGTRKMFIIDPKPVEPKYRINYEQITKTSSEGLRELLPSLIEQSNLIKEQKQKREH